MKGVFSIKVKPWEVLFVYLTHDIKYCPKTSSLKITSIEYYKVLQWDPKLKQKTSSHK